MLTSLRKIVDNQNLEIFVCDNSLNKRKDISELIANFQQNLSRSWMQSSKKYLNAFNKSNSNMLHFFMMTITFILAKHDIRVH